MAQLDVAFLVNAFGIFEEALVSRHIAGIEFGNPAEELFLVVKGRFRMEYRDRSEWIEAGGFVVVPRGVEHRPVAEEEAHVMLFEPASTVNTGSAGGGMTVAELDRI